jgi:hypothetical protein
MASFSKAFSAARTAGKSTFSWSGKSYSTKLKGEKAKASATKTAKSVPVPTPRPSATPTPTPRPASQPAGTQKGPNAPPDTAATRVSRATPKPSPVIVDRKTKDDVIKPSVDQPKRPRSLTSKAANLPASPTGKVTKGKDLEAPGKNTIQGFVADAVKASMKGFKDNVQSFEKSAGSPTAGRGVAMSTPKAAPQQGPSAPPDTAATRISKAAAKTADPYPTAKVTKGDRYPTVKVAKGGRVGQTRIASK